MKQPEAVLPNGTEVITHARLNEDMCRIFGPRKPSAHGVIRGVAAGYGGDVYLIERERRITEAYCFDEFELASDAANFVLWPAPIVSAAPLQVAGRFYAWDDGTWRPVTRG